MEIPHIHGWSSARVQTLQADTAARLGLPVAFRDSLGDGSSGPEMLVIPAGSFLMGSPPEEPERAATEGQHRVDIPRPFAIGRYTVSFDEFDHFVRTTNQRLPGDRPGFLARLLGACAEPGPHHFPDDHGMGRGRHPLINVSWFDFRDFYQWLSRETGRDYRLPTEAEWEYACRAGATTAFWWGQEVTAAQANYNTRPGGEYRDGTLPVDTFEPNPWGLYQVHGNVCEWTASEWAEDYDGSESVAAEWEDAPRVYRGGAWYFAGRTCRSAFRQGWAPYSCGNLLGFRLAAEVAGTR